METDEAEIVPDALAGYTGYLLRRVFARANQVARATLPPGHHPREVAVLRVVAERDAYSQQDLADRLRINRTIMVKVVDKLEDAGYVRRRRNPADRRSYVLSATDAGRRALATLAPAVATGEQTLTASLTPAERRRLDDLLAALVPEPARLNTAPDPAQPGSAYLLIGAHYYLKRRGDEALAAAGIEVRHFGALATLDATAPCSQQKLARQLGLTEPAMVHIVDSLEEAGLVERERDARDRRQYALRLTGAGQARLRQARVAVDAIQADVTATLGHTGDVELRALLRKLLAPAERAAPPTARPGSGATSRSRPGR